MGTTTSTKAATGSMTTTAAGAGTCAMPNSDSDCASCTDNNSCSQCWATTHQAGVQDYNNAIMCLACTACYNVVQETTTDCPNGPPNPKDPCDMGTPGDMTAIQACVMCAQMGSCKAQVTACTNDPDCVAIDQGLPTCPPAAGG